VREKKTVYILIALAVVYTIGLTAYLYSSIYYARETLPNVSRKPLELGERVLVVAPHPDDECLAPAGVIKQALARGASVKVVIVTNGDGYLRAARANFGVEKPGPSDLVRLGRLRQGESTRALGTLGLPAENIVFLGYGDGSISRLWDTNWDYAVPFTALNGHGTTPYENSYEKGAVYCGANLLKNLRDILVQYQPTDVIFPDPDDMNRDHWAVSNFVRLALDSGAAASRLYTYLVHHYQWPTPMFFIPGAGLYPPLSMRGTGTEWIVAPLDRDTRKLKHRALLEYKSQYKTMPEFLDAFVRRNELFGQYPESGFVYDANLEPDFAAGRQLLYAVVHSSVNDSPLLRVEGDDDLRAVAFCANERNYYLALETRGAVSTRTTYVLNCRFVYSDQTFTTIKVFVFGLKASIESDRPTISPGAVEIGHSGRRLWVTVPSQALPLPEQVFVSAETYFLGRNIDKTAWRVAKPQIAP
jgi:LmbE family N-acetylglucosaminyl deacetylase